MRKNIDVIVVALLTMVIFGACQKKSMTTSMSNVVSQNIETSEIRCADSMKNKDEMIRVSIEAEFPKKSDAIVVNSIQEWMSEMLGSTYTGSYSKGKQMLKYYVSTTMKNLKEDNEDVCTELYYDAHFKKAYETDLLVTYYFTMETYLGGAHGSYYVEGVTFRKVDGRRVDASIFLPSKSTEVSEMITKAVQKQYFEVDDEKEFRSMLLVEEYMPYLPMPETAPVYLKKGIGITYQQYEIAPYAAGLPTCVLPYAEVKPLLSVTGQMLLPEAQLAKR